MLTAAALLSGLLLGPVPVDSVEVQVPMPSGPARRMLVHVPPGLPRPVPLVLGFHGGGGTAEGFRNLSLLTETADANGFAVAFMDAGDGVWGEYRATTGSPDTDLEYVRRAIDILVDGFGADRRRVYATGLSNGAAFSFVLAAELADRIAAIAPVCHNLTEAFVLQATPDRPVHVLQIVGTADPLMPFNGGVMRTGEPVGSSDQAMQYWRAVNGNGPGAVVTPIPDTQPDGTTASRQRFTPSPLGFELQRVVVLNGGHTWPGGVQYLPVSVIGLTARDFSAGQLIWDFFADKALPPPPCPGSGPGACSPADWNEDGVVDFNDLLAFINDSNGQTPCSDLNADGVTDFNDLLEFLNLANAGC